MLYHKGRLNCHDKEPEVGKVKNSASIKLAFKNKAKRKFDTDLLTALDIPLGHLKTTPWDMEQYRSKGNHKEHCFNFYCTCFPFEINLIDNS